MQIAMFLIIFSVLMISGITGTPAVPTSTTDKSKDDFISNNVNPEIKEEDKPIEKPSEPEIIHHKPGIAVARIIDDIFQIPIGVLQSVSRLLRNPFIQHNKTPETVSSY